MTILSKLTTDQYLKDYHSSIISKKEYITLHSIQKIFRLTPYLPITYQLTSDQLVNNDLISIQQHTPSKTLILLVKVSEPRSTLLKHNYNDNKTLVIPLHKFAYNSTSPLLPNVTTEYFPISNVIKLYTTVTKTSTNFGNRLTRFVPKRNTIKQIAYYALFIQPSILQTEENAYDKVSDYAAKHTIVLN